jgi:protein-S-isoprenylcysteine O-methyltransferase Ste14
MTDTEYLEKISDSLESIVIGVGIMLGFLIAWLIMWVWRNTK